MYVPATVFVVMAGENVIVPLRIVRSVRIAMPLARPSVSVPPRHVEVCAASYAASVTVCFKWIVLAMSIDPNTSNTNTGKQIASSVNTEARRSAKRRWRAGRSIVTVRNLVHTRQSARERFSQLNNSRSQTSGLPKSLRSLPDRVMRHSPNDRKNRAICGCAAISS